MARHFEKRVQKRGQAGQQHDGIARSRYTHDNGLTISLDRIRLKCWAVKEVGGRIFDARAKPKRCVFYIFGQTRL